MIWRDKKTRKIFKMYQFLSNAIQFLKIELTYFFITKYLPNSLKGFAIWNLCEGNYRNIVWQEPHAGKFHTAFADELFKCVWQFRGWALQKINLLLYRETQHVSRVYYTNRTFYRRRRCLLDCFRKTIYINL